MLCNFILQPQVTRAAHVQGPVKTYCIHSHYLCQVTICRSIQVAVIGMTEEQPSADMNALLADMNALLGGEQKHTSTSVK